MNKRVLITHIPYDWPGGEDQHVAVLTKAYAAIGAEVSVFTGQSLRKDLPNSLRAIVSTGVAEFQQALDEFRPELIHLHNIFPVLGAALLGDLGKRAVPVVMTAHNHRIFCSNGLAFRDGAVCELCVDAKAMWRPAFYNCNNDRAKSVYYAGALTRIRAASLWQRGIDAWIAPSPYMERMLIRQGISEEKIFRIPHAVDFSPAIQSNREFDFVFAGRLSAEKGVKNLVAAAKRLTSHSFLIIGDGPLRSMVEETASQHRNIIYRPGAERAEAISLIARSRVGVLPSRCYESFSLFAFECMASGLNLLVPDLKATKWLSEGCRWGRLMDTTSVEKMVGALEAAIQLPPPSDLSVRELRGQISFEAFCKNLDNMAKALIGVNP